MSDLKISLLGPSPLNTYAWQGNADLDSEITRSDLYAENLSLQAPSGLASKQKEPKPIPWKRENQLRLSYNNTSFVVGNMPLEIRDVPNHPDDTYVSETTQGPVERTEYHTDDSWILSYTRRAVGEHAAWGFRLNWRLSPVFADTERRNYTNEVGTDERGVGAALTFVGITAWGPIPDFYHGYKVAALPLNIIPEVLAELRPVKQLPLHLGTSIGYYRFQAVNGWDRWNMLESRKHYTLAECFPASGYLTLALHMDEQTDFELEFGVIDVFLGSTALGKEAEANIQSPSYFAAMGISW